MNMGNMWRRIKEMKYWFVREKSVGEKWWEASKEKDEMLTYTLFVSLCSHRKL